MSDTEKACIASWLLSKNHSRATDGKFTAEHMNVTSKQSSDCKFTVRLIEPKSSRIIITIIRLYAYNTMCLSVMYLIHKYHS